ncbi:MAG TPA: right-handed parallel beta-helix repeat-containing protein [Candidatus Limnocylindrales bacterium]|nr:right-handed parallel beta-helix repeat-containing protein [Candidatus Limnocylindrales bacterium]
MSIFVAIICLAIVASITFGGALAQGSTGNPCLSTPPANFAWYIGKFSDGTYYAFNSSSWNKRVNTYPWQPSQPWVNYSENYTALEQQCLCLTSYGTVYLENVQFNFSLSIPLNVKLQTNINGETETYVNLANKQGDIYKLSVGSGKNYGYYFCQDSQNNYLNCFTVTNPTQLINSAIRNSSSGDTIDFLPGTYLLDSSVSDSSNPNISLQGSPNAVFTVPTNFDSKIFDISAQNVTIAGLTINARGQQSNASIAAIYLEPSASGCTVKNNYITEATTGVMISDNDSSIIGNSVFNSIHDGITIEGGKWSDPGGQLYGGNRISILGNLVNGSQIYNGISLVAATNCIIKGNTVLNTASNGFAFENFGWGICKNDAVESNTINNIRNGFGLLAYDPYNGLLSSTGCEFSYNHISNVAAGVYVGSGQNDSFTGDQVLDANCGTEIAQAASNLQFNNLLVSHLSGDGIQLLNGTNLQFVNTQISDADGNGIYIVNSTSINFNGYSLNDVGLDGILVDNPSAYITFANGTVDNIH